jgi:4-hydroxymandelate oxidase
MFAGLDMKGVSLNSASLTWDFIKRLKGVTKMKVLIKGLETREDALLAVRNGADGIIVSNHGGRTLDTQPATIDVLPEIAAAVGARVPVLMDGGIRRGGDVFKALALGARAVLSGRPVIWGLTVDGAAGVTAVLEHFRAELVRAMQLCGAASLKDLTPDLVA